MKFVFLFLTYLTLYDSLYVHPHLHKWCNFIPFVGWAISHCAYIHLLYPFICWWTFKLLTAFDSYIKYGSRSRTVFLYYYYYYYYYHHDSRLNVSLALTMSVAPIDILFLFLACCTASYLKRRRNQSQVLVKKLGPGEPGNLRRTREVNAWLCLSRVSHVRLFNTSFWVRALLWRVEDVGQISGVSHSLVTPEHPKGQGDLLLIDNRLDSIINLRLFKEVSHF